ncbi:anti-adapter protein IraP [Erwinia sorbitola]|uniref:Anti-adapter protein IraP n=1 Tax=Erwinia sorbitola TaxID=2681984 RepID=A0A6I6EKV2_9GAMM|nr:anti-adapter protein IraP [Erwinia sorbitola]MTD27171.1 anti-adapter protein IraP [Erwinia sorbitola]QGU88725.1 anti-adapter protein IraP [Erwinia sorbitola]
MKNLIAELLVRLAEKEEESKELVAQVEALEIVVTALLRKLDSNQLQQINTSISEAMHTASTSMAPDYTKDASMLENYIQRLLNHPRQ